MTEDSGKDHSPSTGGSRQQILSMSSPLPDALIGKSLGDRYVVTELLGTGAMGVVYKAKHKTLDRDVAIKILKRDAATDEVSRKRFETEAKAAGALMHPNLIAVHDSGFIDGTPYLVMDYLEGESLGALLKREKRLDPARLMAIFKQICTGLGYAHDKGLIHRDLKPNNIMLQDYANGRDLVKIVDFGIVKPVDGDQELTETGQIFGTPFYMSPEQCQGKKLDARSDIYALGCLIYRIITGRPPFTGENAVATIVMHVKDPPPPFPPEVLESETIRALAPVVMKMLAKDPAERFQSMAEVRIELERLEQEQKTEQLPAQGSSSRMPVVEVEPTEVLPPQTHTRLIATTIGCIVIAMLSAATVAFMLFKPVQKPAVVPTPQQTVQPPVQPVAQPAVEPAPKPAVAPAPDPKQAVQPDPKPPAARARRHRRPVGARLASPAKKESGIKRFLKKWFD